MEPRERIRLALAGKTPDRVPIFESLGRVDRFVDALGIDARETSEPTAAGDEGQFFPACDPGARNRFVAVVEALGLDAVASPLSIEIDGDSAARSRVGDAYVEAELSSFAGLTADLAEAGIAHFLAVPDPFQLSARRCGGVEALLLEYARAPDRVDDLAEWATAICRKAIEHAARSSAAGVFLLGDIAGHETTLVSPPAYRDHLQPHHASLARLAHRRGVSIALHSDGNVTPLLHPVIDAGIDAIHPVQPDCMDIGLVKERVGDRLCLMGNVDLERVFAADSPDAIRRIVAEPLEVAAPGGGYVFSTSHSAEPWHDPPSYLAMTEAVRDLGAYDGDDPTARD